MLRCNGHYEIDDSFDANNVQTSSSHVGGYQHVDLFLFKLFKRFKTLLLGKIAMKFSCSDAQKAQQNVQAMSLFLGLNKYHAVVVERAADQAGQNGLPVALLIFPDTNEFLTQIEGHLLVVVHEYLYRLVQ